jgi:hypothetical protein
METDKGRSNPSGRLFGKYRAVVVNNKHPKSLHLAQVRLLALWDDIPDSDLPWAEYVLSPGAGKSAGAEAMPYQKGAPVWVEFPYSGDTRCPLICGAAYVAPDGTSHLPDDLMKQAYSHKRSGTEPAAPAAQYGDRVTDLFGILQQLTQSGDWCVTHKATGTAFHITKDGHLVLHAEQDSWRTTGGDVLEEVGGKLVIKVEGDADLTANKIKLNGGKGVVTGDHICAYTGAPHSDCSSSVTAAK